MLNMCRYFGLLCFLIFTVAHSYKGGIDVPNQQPTFSEPVPNITVTKGRDISLPCTVDNLQHYRVAWIHTHLATMQTWGSLLALGQRVIARSKRYRVSHDNHRTWWLHIDNVHKLDGGRYVCQVNTSPVMSQAGFVHVLVPPRLDEKRTSSDLNVREGERVSLRCAAEGTPKPTLTWRREDGEPITLGKHKFSTLEDSFLNITKVSRLHMGVYLCIAANSVPPSVSKRIILGVNFTPMIWIPNQLVGAPIGSNVLLQCNLESHPQSVTYWTRAGGVILLNNSKHLLEINSFDQYKFQLKLFIYNLEVEDFGSYSCVAKNSLGETEGTIRLYNIPPPSSTIRSNPESEMVQQSSFYDKERKDFSYRDPAEQRVNLDRVEQKFAQSSKSEGGWTSDASISSAALFMSIIKYITYIYYIYIIISYRS